MREMELVIQPDGSIESIYDDDLISLVSEMGGSFSKVRRASNVEWENGPDGKGWAVRAAHDPSLALRIRTDDLTGPFPWHVSREGSIALFTTREFAIHQEVKFFWKLLEKEK